MMRKMPMFEVNPIDKQRVARLRNKRSKTIQVIKKSLESKTFSKIQLR